MSHCEPRAAATPLLPRSSSLPDAKRALGAIVRSVDAWRDARRRALADRRLLAGMSERELLDIGIARTAVNNVTERSWVPNDAFWS
jgi:uncharacterized protein YjiS (DUF1127 family)